MKKIFVLTMMFVLCLTCMSFAHVVPDKPRPARKLEVCAEEVVENDFQFSTIGVASKTLQADSAIIYARLEKDFETLDISSQINPFQELLTSLYSCGINENEIMLEYSSVFPKNIFTKDVCKSYHYCYNFSINILDLNNLTSVTQVLNDNNVYVKNLNYCLSNVDEEYSNIIASAIEDAKEKAKTISNRDNFEVVDVRSESVFYSTVLNEKNDNIYSSIEIKARVDVVFE